ncbi:MAG: OadG family protein [Thiohalocapsa sp.]
MLTESLRLMGIGMGIVFTFLLLLVGILRAMSWLALRIAPAEPQVPAATTAQEPLPVTPEADDLIAVIAAAIARYRARS